MRRMSFGTSLRRTRWSRLFADCTFEERQGFVKVVDLPKRTGLAQLGDIDTQTGNDFLTRVALSSWGRAKANSYQ